MSSSLQQAIGSIGQTRRTIRWASVDDTTWVHAEDLCNALGWIRPARTLQTLQRYVSTALDLGIRPGSKDDRFVNEAGVQELFARRTGGPTQQVKNFVRARIYHDESVDYESDADEAEPTDVQEEPMVPISEIAAMELLARNRDEATLAHAQSLKARAEVLTEYRTLGGDTDDPVFQSARETLLGEMRRPYPIHNISVLEYIQFQGYPHAAALQLATVFGPDVKRAFKAEYGRDPMTYVALLPGAASNIAMYDRHRDIELLGSCWRNFQNHRAWYRERCASSTQRSVDRHHLQQMALGANNKPAPGWGPSRTQAVTDRSQPF